MRRRRQRGSALIVLTLTTTALVGIASAALDGGRDQSVRVHSQYVADAAGLSAARIWRSEASGPPPASGPPAYSNAAPDGAVLTAQEIASVNGFVTNGSDACVISAPPNLQVAFFDVDPGAGCTTAAPAGWSTEVEVSIPPLMTPLPASCVPAYRCVEVDISSNVANLLAGALGMSRTLVRTSSVADALLPPPLPPGFAVDATENPGLFNSGILTTRAQYGSPCVNCPALWNAGVEAQIGGFDWSMAQSADQGAAAAHGAIVASAGSRTELCDTYQANAAATCSAGLGPAGMAYSPSGLDQAYCGAGPPFVCLNTIATGTGTFQAGGLMPYSAAAAAPAPAAPVTSGLPNCVSLLLNGGTVTSGLGAGHDPACEPPAATPYTIEPGVYSWIAINHGAYTFAPGVYDITGSAPVNTLACPPPLLGGCVAVTSNGIDHSTESASDFDLCTALSVTGCPLMSAGVWIGQGTERAAGAGSTAVPGCGGSAATSLPGGGDTTRVFGRGVSFVFEPASPGFVSTDEIGGISLSAPPLGTTPAATAGVPVLFYVKNQGGWVHLGGPSYSGVPQPGNANGFRGIVYVAHDAPLSGIVGGGVELDPGLAETDQPFAPGTTNIHAYHPALYGQIIADTVIFFGHSGYAVDFQQGWGIPLPPASASAGTDPYLVQEVSLENNPAAGTTELQLVYSGTTALDGYTAMVAVNGTAAYPSAGVWSSPGPPPPPLNNPSDGTPEDPPPLVPAGWTETAGTDADGLTTYSRSPAAGQTVLIGGDWVFGHQLSYASALPVGTGALISDTIGIIPGSTVNWFVSDGTTTSLSPACGNTDAGVAPPAPYLVA